MHKLNIVLNRISLRQENIESSVASIRIFHFLSRAKTNSEHSQISKLYGLFIQAVAADSTPSEDIYYRHPKKQCQFIILLLLFLKMISRFNLLSFDRLLLFNSYLPTLLKLQPINISQI